MFYLRLCKEEGTIQHNHLENGARDSHGAGVGVGVTQPSYFSNVHVPHLSNNDHHLTYNQRGCYRVRVSAQNETENYYDFY